MRKRLAPEDYVKGILAGDRGILSRAITLTESRLPEDQKLSREIINQVMPCTGKSLRVAVTGVPGAGKSTFIEALGKFLTAIDKKIAVLAIDPSSSITKGSILGDKTRMEELSRDPLAFIRPSPTGDSFSGITRRTRESLLLCEAAGFEIILIETVGVGQIETQVHQMVDVFLLLTLTGAGDELQMIKKGVMEIADVIVIHKADGANIEKAASARQEMEKVLKDFPPTCPGWAPRVLSVSSIEQKGIDQVWEVLERFQSVSRQSGFFEQNRESQNISWMRESVLELLTSDFYQSAEVRRKLEELEIKVAKGEIAAYTAAERLFEIFKSGN